MNESSIGSLRGLKSQKLLRLKMLPGVSDMDFSQGELTFRATSKESFDRVKAIVESTIDKSWPAENEDDANEEDASSNSVDLKNATYVHRRWAFVNRDDMGVATHKVLPLSNVKGITRIIIQPRENQVKKCRTVTFLVEGYLLPAVQSAVNSIEGKEEDEDEDEEEQSNQ